MEAVSALIFLMGKTFQQPCGFHPLEQGSHRVRVAGHQVGQFALGYPIMFQKRAHDGKLDGSDFEVSSAAAESLVEPIPSLAKEWWKTLAIGRIDRDQVWGLNWFDRGHN